METLTIRYTEHEDTKETTVEGVTETKQKGKGDYDELWVYVDGELDTIFKDGEVV